MNQNSEIKYQNRALALREIATETVDEERRKLILELAEHYEQLALSEERNRQHL
jgi:hypothetical protein